MTTCRYKTHTHTHIYIYTYAHTHIRTLTYTFLHTHIEIKCRRGNKVIPEVTKVLVDIATDDVWAVLFIGCCSNVDGIVIDPCDSVEISISG